MTILAGTLLLILFLLLGLPVGFALGVAGSISLLFVAPQATVLGLMTEVVHHTFANYVILTIPAFVMMSEFLSAGGIADDMMIACNRLMRKVKGGLAMACVLAGAVLAATSGSSTASVATIARAAYPTMSRLGYNPGLAIGTISIAGTLAIMIPPSIALVVYGILTEESIGKLFIAGIGPGVVTGLGYMVAIRLVLWRNPDWAPSHDDALTDAEGHRLEQKGRVWPVVLLVVLVLGSLYSGLATPTEVGAIGAVGAFLLSLSLGRLRAGTAATAIGNTLRTSAMIVTIIFGALMFGYFMTYTQVTNRLLDFIAASDISPHLVLVLILLMYLLLGMLMDQFAILVLTVPVSYSIVTGLGFDPIWFGILIVKTAEIGLVTPPVGLNVFIASAATQTPTKVGFKGVAPFVAVELVLLALLVSFPEISLFLVN
ncbi:TRAP transporter large permease [Roseovarius indicus]|jgi:C4-dicarboxylate transporter DctM subunit|uniref:TRAP transporter large permease protein n=1 Tax=Roseovarius indicus TaxID=540747 RepID=A0A0T5P3W3_9RHOB|nr:TRAP transporter large permease [Roseovarius indicus]KRS15782.1 C4-dicarboxylate ABC transporter permease [Roseovarius indicus]QEW25207.1 Neu5Ac permease [Roseovarius indicus]SFE18528.1 TRAP transporter, DctM subunit [Roseovarius indicus]